MHVTAKFHHPTFNHSEVIVLTNKQTNKHTPLKTSTSLCYAMPVGKHLQTYRITDKHVKHAGMVWFAGKNSVIHI